MKVTIKPNDLAQIFYSQGIQKEEIALKVLRYTISDEGILKNNKGKVVGSLNRHIKRYK